MYEECLLSGLTQRFHFFFFNLYMYILLSCDPIATLVPAGLNLTSDIHSFACLNFY